MKEHWAKEHWAKEHWAVDERARERTVSGTSWAAEPAARTALPSLGAEGNAPRAEEIAAGPSADGPRHPLLPRAASGGAGAVAALTTEAKWDSPEPLSSRPAEPDAGAGEPAVLAYQAGMPPRIAAGPTPREARLAIELAPRSPASAKTAPAKTASADVAVGEPAATEVEPAADDARVIPGPPGTVPGPAQVMADATHRASQARFGLASAETARASGSHRQQAPVSLRSEDVWPTPAHPAQDETSSANAGDDAPLPHTGPARAEPAGEDRLATSAVRTGVARLIPQVRATPQALSPSVTPALGPVELKPGRRREPDASRPRVAVAPASDPMPAALRPATNAPLHPLTPAEPELMGAAPAVAARAHASAASTPTRGLALPSRDGLGVDRRRLRLLLSAGLVLLMGVGVLLIILLLLYRWVDPPASTLMLSQRFAGTRATQRWIPLERMSPNLVAAVIASEDGHFCRHHGVDWGELKEAIESAGDGLARGGSTISMQVVKNLFLWPSRSYVRKAIEIPLAYSIEVLWSKRRILEIYLNIAQWGPGIFGAEAAARYHFHKPALLLTAREAALLAVSLPNPFERQAGRPGPGTLRLADNLLLRMKAAQANTGCLRPPAYRG